MYKRFEEIKSAKKIIGKMKMKKSAGADEIAQECLLLGKSILASTLTKIISALIKTGVVPDAWKEAVMVQILTKGNANDKANDLSAALSLHLKSWKFICQQVTKFIEDNNLLPKSQHGFRKMRSKI